MESSLVDVVPSPQLVVPLAHTFTFTNNLTQWPTWRYEHYRWVYCTDGFTVPGARNPLIGSLYIGQYLLYLTLYVPSLIVISRPPLIQYTCYKLMLTVGVLDNCVGLFWTFLAGVLSLLGANYCDHTMELIVIGHVAHGLWFVYCASGVLLALNRYLEVRRSALAEKLFAGNRTWLWLIPPVLYGLIGSSSIDLPPIYNSVWSVYFFQIDLREDALPVSDYFCFYNSCWVVSTLVAIYSLLLWEVRRKRRAIDQGSEQSVFSKREQMLGIQAFLICFFIFLVATAYGVAGFIRIPLPLTKFATIAIQMCSGFTSIVYLVCNKTIRSGVKHLLFGNRYTASIRAASTKRGVVPLSQAIKAVAT